MNHSRPIRLWLTALLSMLLWSEPLLAQSGSSRYSMSYLYFGTSDQYSAQVLRTQGSLQTISPDYFEIHANGSLKLSPKLDASFVVDMQAQGIRVVPFLSNHWDRELGREALRNRETLAAQIAEAVRDYGLDGVNVDIENVTEADRDAYTDLVRLLRRQLPDKMVSVAVAANPMEWSNGWHGSYDYAKLAEYSDYLMLMAYDESWEGLATPGPVASIGFVERSVQAALKHVPADKLVLGIPFFGRLWKSDGTLQGAGISMKRTEELVARYNGSVVYDYASQSPRATFRIGRQDTEYVGFRKLVEGNYTVWYENAQSIREKLLLIDKYDLKGAGSWSLSQEPEWVWDYYSHWLQGRYFRDTNQHWAEASIYAAAEAGWMQGTDAGLFAPDRPLTRAEAAAVLVRSAGMSGGGAPVPAAFPDVPANHWASGEIAAAQQLGLVNGLDGRFAPDQPVTREETAAMLARLLQWEGTGTNPAPTSLMDIGRERWSYDYIAHMIEQGIFTGYEDGNFRPLARTTRAEMAVLMQRMASLLN